MATYVRRPNGWQAQIRRVGRPSLTRTFRVRADAEAWAAQKESEIARGSYRERSLDHQLTLGLLIGRYCWCSLKTDQPNLQSMIPNDFVVIPAQAGQARSEQNA